MQQQSGCDRRCSYLEKLIVSLGDRFMSVFNIVLEADKSSDDAHPMGDENESIGYIKLPHTAVIGMESIRCLLYL